MHYSLFRQLVLTRSSLSQFSLKYSNLEEKIDINRSVFFTISSQTSFFSCKIYRLFYGYYYFSKLCGSYYRPHYYSTLPNSATGLTNFTVIKLKLYSYT